MPLKVSFSYLSQLLQVNRLGFKVQEPEAHCTPIIYSQQANCCMYDTVYAIQYPGQLPSSSWLSALVTAVVIVCLIFLKGGRQRFLPWNALTLDFIFKKLLF